jgi:hypothetical protein
MNSPVPLSKKEGDEPEKGKPFWTLMDPKVNLRTVGQHKPSLPPPYALVFQSLPAL